MSNTFGGGITVPKGKIVKFIHSDYPNLSEAQFFLEENLGLKFGSSYAPVAEVGDQKIPSLLGSALNDIVHKNLVPTAGFKQMGFQSWSSTEPLSFSLIVKKFIEKSTALEDVLTPSLQLMKIAIPRIIPNGNGGMTAPGPTAHDIISAITSKYRGNLSIQLGSMMIHDCLITSVDAEFSNEIDIYNHPIWASFRVDVKTIFTANNEIVDELFNIVA